MKEVLKFANMDIFDGGDYFENYLGFVKSDPLNQNFEQFGLESKSFVLLSGSYFVFFVFILLKSFVKFMLNQVAMCFPKNKKM